MREHKYTLEPRARSFRQAKQSKALQEEDAFMELHGGRGARSIFLIVEAGFYLGGLVRKLIGATFSILRRK